MPLFTYRRRVSGLRKSLKAVLVIGALRSAPYLHAQMVNITDTHVTDVGGTAVANGNECFTPVIQGTPIAGNYPGGTFTKVPKCSPVIAGVMNPIQLVRSDTATPSNLCYLRTITDLNNKGRYVMGPTDGFSCVQVFGDTNMVNVPSDYPALTERNAGGAPGGQGQTGQTGATGNPGAAGAGFVDISTYNASSDIGVQLAAASAANSGKVLAILRPGTVGTAVSLTNGNGLAIKAPLQIGAQITVPTGSVTCDGPSAVLTDVIGTGNRATNSIFVVPDGASRVEIRNCYGEGVSSTSESFMVYQPGHSIDVTLEDLLMHNGNIWMQNGASASAPTLRLSAHNIRCVWNTPPPANGVILGLDSCWLAYGAIQDSVTTDERTYGGGHGWLIYTQDAQNYSNEAQILALGATRNTISTSTFDTPGLNTGTVASGAWTSVADSTTMDDITVYNCSDVCLDLEGSSNSHVRNSHVYGGGYGHYSTFYRSINNEFDHVYSQPTGATAAFFIKNSSNNASNVYDTHIHDSTVKCASGGLCTLAYQEANQHTYWENNHFYNAGFANPTTYLSEQHVIGNLFHYDFPIAGVGIAQAGLGMADFNDGLGGEARGNLIETTVPQSVPAIAWGISTPNAAMTADVLGNNVRVVGSGSWGSNLSLSNSGNNGAYVHVWNVHFNSWTAGIPTVTTNGFVNAIQGGNYTSGSGTAN